MGLGLLSRVFIGLSFGGLLGTEILFSQPHLFEKYILAGPALIWNHKENFKLEQAFAERSLSLDREVFTAIGSLDEKNIIEPWLEFTEIIKARAYIGLVLHAWRAEEGTHISMYPATVVRGLRTLLGK